MSGTINIAGVQAARGKSMNGAATASSNGSNLTTARANPTSPRLRHGRPLDDGDTWTDFIYSLCGSYHRASA
jgi:hypothetical protein